jgi:hypothetical protein
MSGYVYLFNESPDGSISQLFPLTYPTSDGRTVQENGYIAG